MHNVNVGYHSSVIIEEKPQPEDQETLNLEAVVQCGEQSSVILLHAHRWAVYQREEGNEKKIKCGGNGESVLCV